MTSAFFVLTTARAGFFPDLNIYKQMPNTLSIECLFSTLFFAQKLMAESDDNRKVFTRRETQRDQMAIGFAFAERRS